MSSYFTCSSPQSQQMSLPLSLLKKQRPLHSFISLLPILQIYPQLNPSYLLPFYYNNRGTVTSVLGWSFCLRLLWVLSLPLYQEHYISDHYFCFLAFNLSLQTVSFPLAFKLTRVLFIITKMKCPQSYSFSLSNYLFMQLNFLKGNPYLYPVTT